MTRAESLACGSSAYSRALSVTIHHSKWPECATTAHTQSGRDFLQLSRQERSDPRLGNFWQSTLESVVNLVVIPSHSVKPSALVVQYVV